VEPGGKQKLQERNYKWLNNDYVKFIAFAEDMIRKNGSGVVSMITDNSYLESPTFRGMRWRLSKSFDKIFILNMHGNSQMKEMAPDGSKDENVFDIKQGVSILVAVRKDHSVHEQPAEVFIDDIYGKRTFKFERLQRQNSWNRVNPGDKFFRFTSSNDEADSQYESFTGLKELFIHASMGIQTHADRVVLAHTVSDLQNQIENHGTKYDATKVTRALYRPFDLREHYNDKTIVQRPRTSLAKNMDMPNYSLCFMKQYAYEVPYSYVLVSEFRSIDRVFISNKGAAYFAPIFIYHDDGSKTPNFNQSELKQLTSNLKGTASTEEVFDYIYAVLHSPSYREKYKELLKIDFPRVPPPKNDKEFIQLVQFGTQLRELHLMKSPLLNNLETTYPIEGSDVVEKLRYSHTNHEVGQVGKPETKKSYKANSVYINNDQYFGNVPETAWNFYIGGYQPAQKWLKDRKGRKLSNSDIEHYQKIIKILSETDRLMKEIDKVWTP
jgi:predicted helicase